MPSAFVLLDNVPGMKGLVSAFLRENRRHITGARQVRWGNFNLIVRVEGRDDHEVDHFITGTLRFCPGVYTIERVDFDAAPEALRGAMESLERKLATK